MELKLSTIGAALAITVVAGSATWNDQTKTLTATDDAGTGNPPAQGTGPGGIPTRWWNGDGNAPQNILQWTSDNNYPYFTTLDGSKFGYGTIGPSVDFSSTVEGGYVVMVGTGIIPAAPANPQPQPPNPNPTPPGGGDIPAGYGYEQISPPASGQGIYPKNGAYNGPMVLDFINQPPGKPGQLGFIKTFPQTGGDLDAGPADFAWSGGERKFDAPVTVYYTTDQPNGYGYPQAAVGSTIRVVVPDPLKPWSTDYRLPSA